MREISVSSFWWNSRVTSFFPVAHWDTLESGISNAVFSFMSNCNRGPVMGDRDGSPHGSNRYKTTRLKYFTSL